MKLRSKKISKRKKSARLRKSRKTKKINEGIKVRHDDIVYDLGDEKQKKLFFIHLINTQKLRPLNDIELSFLKNEIFDMFSQFKI